METTEELRSFLAKATQDDVRGRLLYRGAAWALMRSQGELPVEAPPVGETIETDLAEYGFAVLRAALALRELDGPTNLTSKGFEHAANAFESLVRNGDPSAPERGLFRTIAAVCYHLAGFSAVAYSLINIQEADRNNNAAEVAVEHLILRDFGALQAHVRAWMSNAENADAHLAWQLEIGEIEADDAVARIVNTTVCRSLAYLDFALQTGEPSLTREAHDLLSSAIDLAQNAENVPLWWLTKLCRSLIDDLWADSLHVRLPVDGPQHATSNYQRLRRLFIASLYSRKVAEVELWPSQREAAERSTNLQDDLVVALPTSAGKTRVAEIAALMTLSTGKRVLIVTPLRALSAQTERSFRKTFSPLGFSVSSLYGASGISSGDEDALREKDIVISTPEKLDFALRNDPSLIDDIGLIVLDEGHMIGPTEREIRYETLVQRLLRRSDADQRRIVCLSAILPSGDELTDLTSWMRRDKPGGPVRSNWRPTRQRFGSLLWTGRAARLNYDLHNDGPFISRFVTEMAPRRRDRNPIPRDVKDLTIQAAWEFASQDKRSLIFSTQANWVEGYGNRIVQLVEKGYLPSLLEDPAAIKRAQEVGREWLGSNHPAVRALQVGVAIHHGRLPSPFLRELEILLSNGALKVIVASPTLSQGLNLSAAVLLVPYLVRAGAVVSGEEFANVAGRAGRAFVDTEGLIVHVIFDQPRKRLAAWQNLVDSIKARTLKSGLIQVVAEIVGRLASEGVFDRSDAFEYLANSREAWMSASKQAEHLEADSYDADSEEDAHDEPLSQLIERLDATVFGLIEALDAESEDLPRLLDEALAGSLWARQVVREEFYAEPVHKLIIEARAKLIWKNTTPLSRKGHFAMGVGLEAGLAIDAMANELEALVDAADLASLNGDIAALSYALSRLGERLLTVRPFAPENSLPSDWRDLLTMWISGDPIEEIGADRVRVVEDAFIYRLVWALEAVRTRRAALGSESEIISGGAAAVLETGVPKLMMAMLIRAGLPSRTAAMAAIEQSEPAFVTPTEMRAWLTSTEVDTLSRRDNWPTPDTAALWRRFRQDLFRSSEEGWATGIRTCALDLTTPPPPGIYRIEVDDEQGQTWLATADFKRVARFKKSIHGHASPTPSMWIGLVSGQTSVKVIRLGPKKR